MALQSIRVQIITSQAGSKTAAEDAAAAESAIAGRRALKRIIVRGRLSPQDMQIIKNAVKHYPVSRLFAGGSMEFVEEFIVDEAS